MSTIDSSGSDHPVAALSAVRKRKLQNGWDEEWKSRQLCTAIAQR